jgi:hypothetical protein
MERTHVHPPSNRHLGHSVSLLRPDGRDEREASMTPLATKIMTTHYKMTVLCAKRGISFVCWQAIITTMLEKESGGPKLHQLRVIHLIEADLNLLIKIHIAGRFVWHGETHGILFGGAQTESRPGHPQSKSFSKKNLHTTSPSAH